MEYRIIRNDPETKAIEKAYLNLDEAAKYLSIAKSTLYKHTSKGKISFFKPNGKLILFAREDLDSWITQNRVPANAELDEQILITSSNNNKSKR